MAIKLTGSFPAKIYVYDSRPLPRMQHGDSVELTVVYKPVKMTSVHTGTKCDGKDSFCCYYKRKPIGYFTRYDSLVPFMRRHKKATITAIRIGTYRDGSIELPELYADIPSRKEATRRYRGIIPTLLGRFIGR